MCGAHGLDFEGLAASGIEEIGEIVNCFATALVSDFIPLDVVSAVGVCSSWPEIRT